MSASTGFLRDVNLDLTVPFLAFYDTAATIKKERQDAFTYLNFNFRNSLIFKYTPEKLKTFNFYGEYKNGKDQQPCLFSDEGLKAMKELGYDDVKTASQWLAIAGSQITARLSLIKPKMVKAIDDVAETYFKKLWEEGTTELKDDTLTNALKLLVTTKTAGGKLLFEEKFNERMESNLSVRGRAALCFLLNNKPGIVTTLTGLAKLVKEAWGDYVKKRGEKEKKGSAPAAEIGFADVFVSDERDAGADDDDVDGGNDGAAQKPTKEGEDDDGDDDGGDDDEDEDAQGRSADDVEVPVNEAASAPTKATKATTAPKRAAKRTASPRASPRAKKRGRGRS